MSPKSFHTSWIEIDLSCVRQNLRAVRRWVGPKVEVLAVVKADAYGHGMNAVARALAREGVNFFGVANIREALELRRALPKARILTLGTFHPYEARTYLKHRITPTISTIEEARSLVGAGSSAIKRGGRPVPVHVKIDTGMGRLGVPYSQVEDFFKKLSRLNALSVEGIYTHFACAEGKDRRFTADQIKRFDAAVKKIHRLGFVPRYLHAANSIGLCRFPNAHFNMVRPGIILYGIDPSPGHRLSRKLRPALCLKTRVAHLKTVEAGTPLSYGATYSPRRRSVIATLPVGYSHGYRVGYSNRAEVVIGRRRYPVVGRVTMDQTLVDLGPNPPVRRWDTVSLIGPPGQSGITALELSTAAGTIPYEVVCALHPRIPRIYKGLDGV